MKHSLVVTGGYLDIDFARNYMKTLSFDKVFAVDKGLEYVKELQLEPDYIIGDFDTVNSSLIEAYESKEQKGSAQDKIKRFSPVKDASDTEIAIDYAISYGTDYITLLGATGMRLDHLLANIGLLQKASLHHVCLEIVDVYNRISFMSENWLNPMIIKKSKQFGKYISLLPITEKVEGVTLQGALYPLENETIYRGNSKTVSNEIKQDSMKISFDKGQLLVIESRDI